MEVPDIMGEARGFDTIDLKRVIKWGHLYTPNVDYLPAIKLLHRMCAGWNYIIMWPAEHPHNMILYLWTYPQINRPRLTIPVWRGRVGETLTKCDMDWADVMYDTRQQSFATMFQIRERRRKTRSRILIHSPTSLIHFDNIRLWKYNNTQIRKFDATDLDNIDTSIIRDARGCDIIIHGCAVGIYDPPGTISPVTARRLRGLFSPDQFAVLLYGEPADEDGLTYEGLPWPVARPS